MAVAVNVPFPRLLNDSLGEIRRIIPVSASVSLELTPLSTAEIELRDGETLPEMGWVEMFTPSGSAGIFRVSSPQTGYGGQSSVTQLEHGAVEIGDWLITQEYDEAVTAQAAFSRVWPHYRGNRWQLGTIEASNTVNLSCDHDTVLGVMCDLIDQLPGYMLHFDQTTSPWTVSVKQKPNVVQSEGRLARNVSEATIEFDYTELCTRLYMEGLPSPGYIQDSTAIGRYGIIERHLSGDEDAAETGETESVEQDHASRRQQIMRVAQAYLEKYKKPKCTIQISGADFSAITGEPLDNVEIGNLYRLALHDYNTTVEETVISVHWDDIYTGGFACAITLSEDDSMITLPIVQLVQNASGGSGGGGGGGGGGSREAMKEQFKRYQTFIQQTDEYIKLLATESEWDELAQAGRVTAYTELTRAANFVEDTAAKELPYEDWKAQTLAFDATADVSEEAYRAWITANPYAIYNTEYSDATRTERIISKTGINSLGADETIMSRITQEADRVESSVYASQSQVYSAIGQTASSIRVELADTEQNLYNYINLTASGIRQQITNAGNRTIVNDTDPRGETYTPKDGDIWIESVHDGTWDGADGFDWEHDEDYDWTQVQGAKVWTWKNDQWQLVADRQQLVTYSDFVNTADILISQKIAALANEQGQVEVYRSLIEQSAEQIRAEVYGATSNIYTYIHQTASSVSIAAGQRPTTVVQNSHTAGTPTSINGRGLKENDIWIDTADQDSWDAALDFNWNDDLDYNWNDLRSDKIYVYRNGAWQLAVDGTILAEDTDLQVERDRIALLARNIDTLDGYARENFAQVNVRANEIYSEVLDRTNNLGSSIAQTATQIRSEVHAANSQIYSEIVQTASNILLHVENAVSDLGATLEVTASQIRSDVYATQSSVYSSIVQTASQIRSEVASTTSSLRTLIKQNADSIELKVSKGDISSTINQTAQSVLISASRINLEGYVTADELSAVSGDFEKLTAGTTTATALKAALLETTGNLNVKGTNYSGVTLKIGSVVSATVLSSSSAAMDFDHYHSISISESGGVITVKTGKASSSEGSANFNMADTAFYTNAMSAQWAAARAKVEMPSQGTDTTFTVKVPSATEGEQETKTFTIQKGATPASSGYASVALSGTVVGRIAIGDWYDAGYSSGYSSGKSDGASGVYFYSTGLWSNGSRTITLSNGKSTTVSIPENGSFSGTKISDTQVAVTFQIAGKAFNGVVTIKK